MKFFPGEELLPSWEPLVYIFYEGIIDADVDLQSMFSATLC